MKIAVVLDRADLFGGGPRFASWLISALGELGHEVACVSLAGPMEGKSYNEFLEVKKWFTPSRILPPRGKLYQLLITLRGETRRCEREFDPAAIINTTPFPPILLNVKARKIQYLYYPFELSLTRRGNVFYRAYRAPIWRLNKDALSQIDLLIAISNYSKQATLNVWGDYISEDRISIIYAAAIDVGSYQRNVPRERKVCYVGRIHPSKGIDVVVRAFEMIDVPDSKLVIAGGVDNQKIPQEYYSRLKEREANFGHRLELISNPSDDEIVEIYASSRAFANFYPEEHFGIVPIEAMAAGTPPIVARGGGQIETVIDGKTGFLVSNAAEMCNRMHSLLTDDPLFQRMSEDARRHVAMNFSKEAFIQKWKEALEKLLV